jgi:hypothetical protein
MTFVLYHREASGVKYCASATFAEFRPVRVTELFAQERYRSYRCHLHWSYLAQINHRLSEEIRYRDEQYADELMARRCRHNRTSVHAPPRPAALGTSHYHGARQRCLSSLRVTSCERGKSTAPAARTEGLHDRNTFPTPGIMPQSRRYIPDGQPLVPKSSSSRLPGARRGSLPARLLGCRRRHLVLSARCCTLLLYFAIITGKEFELKFLPVELRGLEPLTPCLQIVVITQEPGRELACGPPVSDRGIPLVTLLNGTLMARRSRCICTIGPRRAYPLVCLYA